MRALSACLVLVTLSLGACVPDKFSTKPEVSGLSGAAPVQTLYDPAGTVDVTLRPGGQMVLELPSNPSTGYAWTIRAGWSSAIIELTDQTYEPTPVEAGIVGSGGTTSFRFSALAPGETSVTAVYARAGQPPVDQRRVDIEVIR